MLKLGATNFKMSLHAISSSFSFLLFSRSNTASLRSSTTANFAINRALMKLSGSQQSLMRSTCCGARRRVRYEEEDEEGYGHNEEIAMLELYSQSARGEALLVKALVDKEEVEVLIFKGFSSSLSHRTSSDPSKSVLPARAVIKSLDRIKGPFDPSNIEYIEKDLQWKAFKSRLAPT